MGRKPQRQLKRGWTTGACAAAAARAAYEGLVTGRFPDPVTVRLPGGQRPGFALAETALTSGRASAAVVKDAGDDPDVTHRAVVRVSVAPGQPGSGVGFRAGEGVGTVTRPGLAVPVGEPAINPGPRQMIREAIQDAAEALDADADVEVTIGVDGGEALARKTTNGRLGIVGGLSILGTTGIVIPYSCSSWIASIHQGIDVARATGQAHLVAATGSTSERAVQRLYGLPDEALIDMGDFVGATLKYLRRHPVKRLTIAGGFAKLSKLAAGHKDLHSARSQVDVDRLADLLAGLGAAPARVENARRAAGAGEVLALAGRHGRALADAVAHEARRVAQAMVGDATAVEVMIFDRAGVRIGYADR
ncbi:MAG: cobalt-precorrin-5B (C(1))-methyltransferase [Kiloniellales bacterium]